MGWYVSSAKEEKALAAVGKGALLSAAVMPAASMAADRYVYFFDAPNQATVTDAWAVANPTALIAGPFLIQKGSAGISADVGEDENIVFQTGLVAAASTSDVVYTASGSADFRVNISTMERF